MGEPAGAACGGRRSRRVERQRQGPGRGRRRGRHGGADDGVGRQLDIEHGEFEAADERQDGRLAIEPAAQRPRPSRSVR
jgi:hypothetical protein